MKLRNETLIYAKMRKIMVLHERMMNRELKRVGLTMKQGQMLGDISRDEGINQTDLAVRLDKRNASATSMLQTLEKRGYIERVIPSDNERQKKIYLLPKGKKVVHDLTQLFSTVEEDIFDQLNSDDQNQLLVALDKILDGIADKTI
ncbi:MarR family winged helix-turn-helix transcriptional regulator [Lactiplantibacillus plantarum]|uniref:MarR family winged helix-turn-helix transcriptional regulator n=1 Tax=Lactiplantibacillus plantarum TaxID=1590 RepID=UPI00093506BE|nr:MarR family transcriptional regulator [Lactiplantibacillus plantarum]